LAPQPGRLRQFPAQSHLRTIALQGQGVDESGHCRGNGVLGELCGSGETPA
jgi:hypothetical protein